MTVLLAISVQVRGKAFIFEYQKNIEVPERSELIISNKSGQITVTGAPVSVMTIDAVKNIRATDLEEAEEVAEHIEIKVNRSGQKVTVKTRVLKMTGRSSSFWEKLLGSGSDSFGTVDFTITVPHECDITIDNYSGDISVSDVTSSVHVSGSSGDFRLENIEGDIDINSGTGTVYLSDITGRIDIAAADSGIKLKSIAGAVDVRSTSGDKVGEYILGSVAISQTSGTIDLKYLSGDLRIESTSGDVTVEQEEGSVHIATHSGNVNVKTELQSDREYYVQSGKGSILFKVPELSSGTAKLETVSGEINAELPMSIRTFSQNRLTGSFGDGGRTITLVTSSGDITIGAY